MTSERVVFLRHSWRGKTWCFIPVTQLELSSDAVVLRIGADTEWLAACDAAGRRLRLGERLSWQLGRVRWTGKDLTYLIPFDAWLAFGLLNDAVTGEITDSYINFQQPIRAAAWGFDTLDLELDLTAPWLAARPSAWRWKDRPRFLELAREGFLSADEVRAVEEAAQTAQRDYELVSSKLQRWAKVRTRPPPLALGLPGLPEDLAVKS
jgi:hypothetical protein